MIGKEILNENDLAAQLVHGIKYLLKDDKQTIDEYLEKVRSDDIATCVKIKEFENLILCEKDKKIIDNIIAIFVF